MGMRQGQFSAATSLTLGVLSLGPGAWGRHIWFLITWHFGRRHPPPPPRCPCQLHEFCLWPSPPDSNQPRLLSSECTQVPFNEPRSPCRDRQENKSLPCGSWGHLMRSGGQKGAQSPPSRLWSQPSLPAGGVQDFLLAALHAGKLGGGGPPCLSGPPQTAGEGWGWRGWAATEAPRAGQLVEGWGRPQRVFFLPPPLGTPSPL